MTLPMDGLIPATVLPMTKDGEPDEGALRRYIRWITEQGPVALAINVDTGEGPHLTHGEKVRVLEVVKEETRLPCLAGVAGPFTSQAVAQAKDLKAAGADALLVFPIPAYLSTPLDPEIPYRYHRAIATAGLPLVLFQLQPALGGVNYQWDVLERLIAIEDVAAIKEASFDTRRYLDTVRSIQQLERYKDGNFTILSGNDNFIWESFVLGCSGVLIGFGAIMTREQVQMIDAWKAGKLEASRDLGERIQRLADVVFAPPVANYRARLKEALVMLGVLETSYVREPLIPIGDNERTRLRKALIEAGLMEGETA